MVFIKIAFVWKQATSLLESLLAFSDHPRITIFCCAFALSKFLSFLLSMTTLFLSVYFNFYMVMRDIISSDLISFLS